MKSQRVPRWESKKKKVWASIKPLQQLLEQSFFFFITMDTKRTLPPPTKNERTGLIEWNLSSKEFSVSLNNFRSTYKRRGDWRNT